MRIRRLPAAPRGGSTKNWQAIGISQCQSRGWCGGAELRSVVCGVLRVSGGTGASRNAGNRFNTVAPRCNYLFWSRASFGRGMRRVVFLLQVVEQREFGHVIVLLFFFRPQAGAAASHSIWESSDREPSRLPSMPKSPSKNTTPARYYSTSSWHTPARHQ